jgi:hypothetical protein
MIDRATHTDHRREAAMMTDHGSSRGWDFRPAYEVPLWLRALAEVFRPRSIFLLAVVAGVLSLFWIA